MNGEKVLGVLCRGTEDADIFVRFKEKYRDRVITNRRHFVPYN